MKYHFKIEGGFTGKSFSHEDEIESLPEDYQALIQKLYNQWKTTPIQKNVLSRDTFKYSLKINEKDDRIKSIQIDERSIPDEFVELFKFLKEKTFK